MAGLVRLSLALLICFFGDGDRIAAFLLVLSVDCPQMSWGFRGFLVVC